MQVRSLGWEDPLEEGMPTLSSILAWRIPWTEQPGGHSPWGCKELDWLLRQHTGARSSYRSSLCYSAAPFSTEETVSYASSCPWGRVQRQALH